MVKCAMQESCETLVSLRLCHSMQIQLRIRNNFAFTQAAQG
jgi:hypothetical protein